MSDALYAGRVGTLDKEGGSDRQGPENRRMPSRDLVEGERETSHDHAGR